MPRKCSICAHPQADEINEMLVGDKSFNDIVTVYTGISKMALSRHMNNHLPATLVKAKGAAEVAKVDTLWEAARGLWPKSDIEVEQYGQ